MGSDFYFIHYLNRSYLYHRGCGYVVVYNKDRIYCCSNCKYAVPEYIEFQARLLGNVYVLRAGGRGWSQL